MAVLGIVEINGWPCVACLGETALEDLHDAMRVGMTVGVSRVHGEVQEFKTRAAYRKSVLTGCLLRCGRIDLMIGEQSRFVSQEYRALGVSGAGHIHILLSI